MARRVRRAEAPETVDLPGLVRQLKMVKDQQNLYSDRYREVKNLLFEVLDESGVEDDKGHLVIEFEEPIDGVGAIIKQRKASVTLDQPALEELLKEKGLYDECTTTVVVLDEDKVHKALFEKKISEEEFESCVKRSITWSLVQKKA